MIFQHHYCCQTRPSICRKVLPHLFILHKRHKLSDLELYNASYLFLITFLLLSSLTQKDSCEPETYQSLSYLLTNFSLLDRYFIFRDHYYKLGSGLLRRFVPCDQDPHLYCPSLKSLFFFFALSSLLDSGFYVRYFSLNYYAYFISFHLKTTTTITLIN